MLFTATWTNLETIAPGIDTNPADINPGQPGPTTFYDQVWPGGTTISIEGLAYSAGMSKRSVAVLAGLFSGVRQVTHSMEVRISETALLYQQVCELDLRAVDAGGLLYPGDVQKNMQQGGLWQFTKDGTNWTATAFKTGLWIPDAWTPIAKVYEVDFTKHTITLTSITDGSDTWVNPSPVAVPAIANLGWPANFFYEQDQEGRNGVVGSYGYERSMRNIGIQVQ